jgi:hypothetical protein
MLSEKSQNQEDKYHVFSHIQNLDLKQTNKQEIMNVKGRLFGGTSGRGEGDKKG